MAFFLPLGTILLLLILSSTFSSKIKLSLYEKPIFITGFIVLFLNYTYFIFGFNFKIISILILIFLIISTIYLIINEQNFLKNLKKIIFPILPILFLFQIIFFIYGEQFYVFRGNQQDAMVYLTTGVTFFNHTYNDLLNLQTNKNNFTDDNYYLNLSLHLIEYRPSVGLIIGLLNNFKFTNIIVVGYIFKILCTCLTVFACISFFEIFEKNKTKIFLLSNVFILSFFYFYNFEIDAFSLILSLPFFILSLKYLFQIYENQNKNYEIIIIKYFLISAIFFIVYPNGAAAIIIPKAILFCILIFRNFKNHNFLKYIFSYLGLFLIIIVPTYKTTLIYLLKEMDIGLTYKPDFWGYYGAFIFGKDNPIHDRLFVDYIKSLIVNNNNFFETIELIIRNNFDNNQFFLLNIIPSIFGFFHLTTSKEYGNFNIILFIVLIYLNYYLIKNLLLNIYNITKGKKNYHLILKVFMIYFLIFFLYLIFSYNLWSSIKLYFMFSPIMFSLVIFSFKENAIKPVSNFIIFLIILLPFYKYSTFNYGIGVLDSFPSIIKKEEKYETNWVVDKNKLSKCKKILFKFEDHREKNYISILHNSISGQNSLKNCSIYKKNNKFNIEAL